MKHLAKIQSEFLKYARKWDDLSYEEQKGYLQRHPKTKRRITAQPGNEEKNETSPKVESKKPATKQNSKLSQTAIDIANTLAKKLGSQAPTSIDDFAIKDDYRGPDIKEISLENGRQDPIYAAKISIHNTEHWNPIHRNTISWLERHPEDAKNYSKSGTAKELIEGYKKLITENHEEVAKTEKLVNDLNTAVQESLSQIDLSDLKGYNLAVITPNRRHSYFLFVKDSDKDKLQAITKTRGEGRSAKLINPSKASSIMGTISPYLTTLAVLKLKDEVSKNQ